MTYRDLCLRLTTVYPEREARAIVRLVLEERFGLSLTDVAGGAVEQLPAESMQELDAIMARLEQAEPVQYVLGAARFCGRDFLVGPGVLIPRPETEELCQWVMEERGERILDIGTGSGCIACTLAAQLPQARVTAWDISDDALRLAAENAKRAHVLVSFRHQDALTPPADKDCWDIIVSNPPYVGQSEAAQMERHVLDFEPALALFVPDDDPLIFYHSIARYALTALRAGGRLFFELNPLHADALHHDLEALGYVDVEQRRDQQGRTRFIKATRP